MTQKVPSEEVRRSKTASILLHSPLTIRRLKPLTPQKTSVEMISMKNSTRLQKRETKTSPKSLSRNPLRKEFLPIFFPHSVVVGIGLLVVAGVIRRNQLELP